MSSEFTVYASENLLKNLSIQKIDSIFSVSSFYRWRIYVIFNFQRSQNAHTTTIPSIEYLTNQMHLLMIINLYPFFFYKLSLILAF